MVINMEDLNVRDIKAVKEFLEKADDVNFEKRNREEAYKWIKETLRKFDYFILRKKDKTIVKRYIRKMTGYSRKQVTNLIAQFCETGEIKSKEYERHKFERKYTDRDIRLLAETMEIHDYPTGGAVKRNLQREAEIYGQAEYKNISEISVSHIYNLNKTVAFQRAVTFYKGTQKSRNVGIGKRMKPEPEGRPGFIRIDTVEQGDTTAGGGVYHINTVDEKTQWQVLGSVDTLEHENVVPLLEELIEGYPFKIINFHTDNGSEYINKFVAELLDELLIGMTKSRPRHSNDNALAETKNNLVRKWIGYGHIQKKFADDLNEFYQGCFNEYLNYHRICAFPHEEEDKKGKVKKKYPLDAYMTPYEKLKSIPSAEKYLKNGVTFEKMDKIAMKHTDNEMAKIVQEERSKLFDKVFAVA